MAEILGATLGYLSRCCYCCCRSEDILALESGSEFRSRAKRDPREQQIDDEFRSRKYTRDASGRFQMEARPSTLTQKSTSDAEPKPENTTVPELNLTKA
ncbi:hypothetical protein DFP72DRAFT_620430 [Ephemerocybe angulata]|uniref:Uncharacterized protein n=1 Tax=Ephemerocybe angulata TaxID=980116 RepID=A0A8H6HH66_9AGAR|nr:hypothetical protein DFP72DRAFT_620430 [Tulosesus angulatus]